MGRRRGLLAVRSAGRAPGRGHVLLRVRGLRLHRRVRRGGEEPAEVHAAGHRPVAVHRVPRLLRRVVRPHPDVTVLRTSEKSTDRRANLARRKTLRGSFWNALFGF